MNYKTLEDVKRVITLGKKDSVIDMFIGSYLQGLQYENWLQEQKTVHKLLGGPLIAIPAVYEGEDIVTPASTTINANFVPFEEWMKETEDIADGTKDILDEEGNVTGTETIYTAKLIRVYDEVVVDVEQWKVDNYKELRAASYPKYTEFMDAWVKDDAAELEAYRTKCLDVKAKYKKTKSK